MLEVDLDGAAEAGIIGEDQANALRRYMAEQTQLQLPSSEKFQLVSGLADATRAIGLVLITWLLPIVAARGLDLRAIPRQPFDEVYFHFLLAGFLMMASAVLILRYIHRQGDNLVHYPATTAAAMIGGTLALGVAGMLPSMLALMLSGTQPRFGPSWLMLPLIGTFLYLFWRWSRFPPTPAFALGLLTVLLAALLHAVENMFKIFGDQEYYFSAVMALGLGLITLVCACWLDLTDIRRETRRSQTAFWLHVAAGILVSRAIFSFASNEHWASWRFLGYEINAATMAVLFFLVIGSVVVSLLLDRRSLMLAFTLPFAGLAELFGLIIAGMLLLLLSYRWSDWRSNLLRYLPAAIAAQLPRSELAPEGQRPTRRHLPLEPRRWDREQS